MYIYACMGGGMRKTLNLKNGQHFPLFGDLKNIIFRAQAMYIHVWAAASQQRPKGQLRQANTTLLLLYGWRQANSGPKANCGKPHTPYVCIYGRWRTDSGPKANCGKPTQPYIYACTHHTPSIHPSSIDPHAINQHNPFIVHCSGSMLSLV